VLYYHRNLFSIADGRRFLDFDDSSHPVVEETVEEDIDSILRSIRSVAPQTRPRDLKGIFNLDEIVIFFRRRDGKFIGEKRGECVDARFADADDRSRFVSAVIDVPDITDHDGNEDRLIAEGFLPVENLVTHPVGERTVPHFSVRLDTYDDRREHVQFEIETGIFEVVVLGSRHDGEPAWFRCCQE